MPLPKELGPAQPRIDAGHSELEKTPADAGPPPAGPHADKSLINEDATPGTGMLPDPSPGNEADPAGG